jgi:3,4-dihydroxy 2-butanone 4-phosphate synthase/GTP cyclohydrolase II
VKVSASSQLPTKHGLFEIRVFQPDDAKDHVVVYKGELRGRDHVPVRIHSECLTGEVFNSLRCDCNEQLEAAMDFIEAEGFGLLIYLRQEGRGIGLFNKIRAYALQDTGLDTVEANEHLGFPADLRRYDLAAQILKWLGIRSVRLLTNNPRKVEALQAHGIQITQCVRFTVSANPHNSAYLWTKRVKLNHAV